MWVRGCGCVGVGAWVCRWGAGWGWARGCGWVGVGAWVGRWGGGMEMGGRGMRQAGLGWSLSDGANRLPVLTQPEFGLPARV